MYLGHIISLLNATDPEKVKAVAVWPILSNVSEILFVHALCSYYRRFILDSASIAIPLPRLTEKGRKFQ